MKGVIAAAWNDRVTLGMSLTATRRRLTQHLTQRAKRPPRNRTNYIPITIGEPGIGKSKMMQCIADDLGWKFKRWDVNTQGFEDVTGLPVIDEQKIGDHVQKVARFAKAAFVPGAVWEEQAYTLGEIGELPTAPPTMQNILREMIDGQLNGDPLDPKCLLVATGNPPEARFTTGNMIDEAIEDRLDPYIVIPTTQELLIVWARIMFPTVYQFLSVNESMIDSLSPRHWMVIAEKVENLRQVGETPEAIVDDVKTAFVNHKEVIPPLLVFLKHGDDPEKLPILGRDLLSADEPRMDVYSKRIEKWLAGESTKGFVGATKNDVIRIIPSVTTEEVGNLPHAGRNLVRLLELLVDGHCQDMAKNLLDVVYPSKLSPDVIAQLKKSPALRKMSAMYAEFQERMRDAQSQDSNERSRKRK